MMLERSNNLETLNSQGHCIVYLFEPM